MFCGGVGSLESLVRAGQRGFHSVYLFVPGLLSNGVDHPRLVPALVPRPLLVCGTDGDAGMPVEGLREFAAAAETAYAEQGIPDRFELLLEPGSHAMTPTVFEKAAGWLTAKLGIDE